MHSPQDTTVGISHAEVMYKEAKHPKSFVYLDKADHLLTNEKDAFFAGKVWSDFIFRVHKANPKTSPGKCSCIFAEVVTIVYKYFGICRIVCT